MALQKAGVKLVADGLSGFMSDMGKANSAVSGFGDQGAKSGSTFAKGFSEVTIGALRQVGAALVDFGIQGAKALGGFLSDSVTKAGDFQAQMLEFQAVAGKDVDTKGLEKFHDLFIQLGKDLPVSTADVQQAAIEMVKGGIDPATVAAGGLRQNIQFAAAAMSGDLAGAAEISAKILGGWSDVSATAADKAAFLTHSTDLLTKAANASSVDVHELSLGIFNAQGIARTAGVSFDDLTTTLAELAPRFASSSEAGNSLKNVIARLQPTTDPAYQAMAALGLITEDGANKFYDAQGKFVGFSKASQLLQNSLKGLTQQEKQATLQRIFGNDAMNAAAALAELGSAGYDQMAESLAKANGVAENAALKQQGFNTAMENAKGSVEALQITLGEKLLPILTTFLNSYIAPAINAVTQFADAFFSAEDPVGFLVAKVDQFSPTLGTLVAAIGDFITTGGDWGVVIDDLSNGFDVNLAPAIQTVSNVLGTMISGAQTVIGFISDNFIPILSGVAAVLITVGVPAFTAWAGAAYTAAAATIAAMAPVALPIAAIGVAVALLVKAWTSDFGGIRTMITQWWNNTLQPIFAQAQTWLAQHLPAAIEATKVFFVTELIPAMQIIWSFLTTTLFPAFQVAWTWLSTTIPAAVQTTANFWNNTLLPAFTAVSTFLNTYIFPFFQALENVHMALVRKGTEATAGIWQKVLLPAFKAVWGFIQTYIIPIFKAFVEVNIAAINKGINDMRYLWQNWLLPAMKVVAGYIGGPLNEVFNNFSGFVGAVSSAINSLGSTVKHLIGWLSDLASKIASIKLPDWMTPGSPTPWEIGLRGVGDALKTEVNPQIKALFNTLTVAPPASAAQIMGASAGSTTNNYTRSINMPVTTNMTPNAITMSGAILNALLP
jgi:TP901 family phage tail tape measure protein